MNKIKATMEKVPLLGKLIQGQSYLNLLYLLASFPMGVIYFVFLVSGIATGLSLLIVWLGVPVLLIVGAACWGLANFERMMAITMLREDIPPMNNIAEGKDSIWMRLKAHVSNPVTWKSVLYLFLKFPLGLFNFVVLITLLALTAAFISMPFTYQSVQYFSGGISFGMGSPIWHIDSLGDALLGMVIGFVFWMVTLTISDGLAWFQAKIARLMLGSHPLTV